ncbi:ROK family protein [Thermodesulfobacterium sp. TA1]|uniref:glucokinase n=1 Tax=Thermodesulfobacterium sp. TA1 TaxID=2234087 RepID=UPI001232CE83|nr:ROK family protein [Thermodesulfobacterium sp. TA1]QER42805.1 ROK family protein [Thermodesulfobacterium sp. TA1]
MLLADIGGTNSRLAVLKGKRFYQLKIYRTKGYKNLSSLIKEYLTEIRVDFPIEKAYLAVAGPVVEGKAKLTNLGWQVSSEELKKKFDFKEIFLVNDLHGLALGSSFLSPKDFKTLKKGKTKKRFPKVFLAPGTGLGVSVLIEKDKVLPSENGHIPFCALKKEEFLFLSYLEQQQEEVCWEKALSGKGVSLWYDFYFKQRLSPEEIFTLAKKGDQKGIKIVEIMLELLGRKTSELALTFLPEGGIYLSGGLVLGLKDFFNQKNFLDKFLTGYFKNLKMEFLLKRFAVKLITHPYPVLLGGLAILHNR